MRRQLLLCSAAAVIGLSCVNGLLAEDARPVLPEPGSWVKYFVTQTLAGGSQRNYYITFRWLDRATENNEACRWVEFDYEPDSPDAIFNQRIVAKALIPESRLVGDPNPLKGGVRGWVRTAEQPVEPLEQVYQFGTAEIFVGAYFAWLPGARQGAKTVPQPRTIEHERGQLRCETANVGTYRTGNDSGAGKARTEYAIDYTMWRHEELKCGFAAAKLKWTTHTVSETGEVSEPEELWTHEPVAVAFGMGAQSLLTNTN